MSVRLFGNPNILATWNGKEKRNEGWRKKFYHFEGKKILSLEKEKISIPKRGKKLQMAKKIFFFIPIKGIKNDFFGSHP